MRSFSAVDIQRDSLLSNLNYQQQRHTFINGSQTATATADADITKENSQEDDTVVLSSRRQCLSASAINPIVFEVRQAKHNPFNRFNDTQNANANNTIFASS